jgi:hypothetical protein
MRTSLSPFQFVTNGICHATAAGLRLRNPRVSEYVSVPCNLFAANIALDPDATDSGDHAHAKFVPNGPVVVEIRRRTESERIRPLREIEDLYIKI